jgi:hypothetical protein
MKTASVVGFKESSIARQITDFGDRVKETEHFSLGFWNERTILGKDFSI